jgi:hypothetical protein
MDYISGSTINPEPIGPSLLLHKFAPSVKMSSYLVAFVIGNFVSLEKQVTQAPTKTPGQSQEAKVLVRVWGTPKNAAKLQYALDSASAMIPHFSKVHYQKSLRIVLVMNYVLSRCSTFSSPSASATLWPFRTSLRAPWKTGALSRTVRLRFLSTLKPPPFPTNNALLSLYLMNWFINGKTKHSSAAATFSIHLKKL